MKDKYHISMLVPGMPFDGRTLDHSSLGGCITGDTLIDVPRDVKEFPDGITIKTLLKRYKKGKSLYVYCYSKKRKQIVLRKVKKIWRTKRNAHIWKVCYEWKDKTTGEIREAFLRATPEHKVMLRDGSYLPLCELRRGMSLMPFNRFLGPRSNSKYYRIDLNNGTFEYEHRLVIQELGIPYNPRSGMKGDVVHHKNFHPYDNTVSNLEIMDWKDHMELHKGPNPSHREWYNNLSKEEYAEFCEKQKENSNKRSIEVKRNSMKKAQKKYKKWVKERSKEDLRKHGEKISKALKKAISENPEYMENCRRGGLTRARMVAEGKLKAPKHTEETKKRLSKIRINWWSSLSDEKKSEISKAASARSKQFWDSLTEKEKREKFPHLYDSELQRQKALQKTDSSNHKVISVCALLKREDVYDVEVEDVHNFTANGIIIHNSETAGLSMARELARLGHHVRMFANCEKPGEYDGVIYQNLANFQMNMQAAPGDVLIIQRTPEPFISRSAHRLHLLWCHDLALGRQTDAYRSVCWNVDRFITVSEWMKKQYVDTYGLPEESIYASRNGIDLFRFPKVDLKKKLRKRLVYAARPERGMDILLDHIFPALLEKDPEFELALFGYDNPVDHLKDFYADISVKAQKFGDKIKFMGNLAKPAQYQAYCDFGIYAYPTPSPKFKDFNEVSCISAMEALAAGMPIVTSKRGALPETIPTGAATLIDGDPSSSKYQTAFIKAILDYVRKPKKYDAASAAGMKHAQTLGWDRVAEDWTEFMHRLFAENNDDKLRLAYHFYRRSDIFAAKAALVKNKTKAGQRLVAKIDKEYRFTNSPESLRKHYIKGGKATDKRLSETPPGAFQFQDTDESRFHVIRDFLAKHEECKSILDYGCGHGWSTIYLGNQLGRDWTGVDIDHGAVKWAEKFAKEHGVESASYNFVVGDHLTDLGDKEPFDCVILSELLEHCSDPYTVFDAVEKKVKKNGTVIITTPYGPSEYGTPNWENFRGHLWEFDAHDLNDMFGKKPDYAVSSAAIFANAITGEMIGYHFITFRADHKPIGKINMQRKLRLQQPRQTISASIIAGRKAELTLGWCLESIYQFVDEIIIADTGLSKLGKQIAKEYGVQFVKGSDPLEAGFETPRNEALDACSMDWVLWIDSDEKLLGGSNLSKYARHSIWHGLSIKQHHFSIDAGFRPDMPVRMFRRGPFRRKGKLYGKVMRHFGKIHEHPELKLNEGPGDILVLPDVNIAHVGYLDEATRQVRFNRNVPLLQMDREKYPDRLLQKHFIMRDNMLLCGFEAKRNGGKITDQMRQLSEETVELYREYFLGKTKYANIDSLQYYTQALQVLGQGVDVSFLVAASRDGIGDDIMNGQPVIARFANVEEAKSEITHMIEQKFDPLLKGTW